MPKPKELRRIIKILSKYGIEFIIRMRDIDLEEAVTVNDFSKRYGLK